MIYVWVQEHYDRKSPNHSHAVFQLVLQQAMDYANTASGMHLSFNHPFSVHKTIEANSLWIDVDGDGLSVLQNNNTIICVSDDESDDLDEPNQLVDIRRNGCTTIEFVSKKHYLLNSNDWSMAMHKLVFVMCFNGTHFLSIPSDKDSAKCPLCCQMVEPKALNLHFKDCDLFRV